MEKKYKEKEEIEKKKFLILLAVLLCVYITNVACAKCDFQSMSHHTRHVYLNDVIYV